MTTCIDVIYTTGPGHSRRLNSRRLATLWRWRRVSNCPTHLRCSTMRSGKRCWSGGCEGYSKQRSVRLADKSAVMRIKLRMAGVSRRGEGGWDVDGRALVANTFQIG